MKELHTCFDIGSLLRLLLSHGNGHQNQRSRLNMLLKMIGWFLFRKFDFINFYMVSSCSILFPDFRTVFVFALRPFLPLSVKFSSSWIFYTLKTSQKYAKLTKWPKITFRGPIWVPRWSNWGFWGWFGSLKVVSEFWFGHPKCHFLYPQNGKNGPFWPFWAVLGVPKMALWVPESKFRDHF